MYLAFKNQSPKALIAQLKEVNYLWVVISMFFGFIAIVSRGLRWVILLKNLNFSVSKLNSVYAVLSAILPILLSQELVKLHVVQA